MNLDSTLAAKLRALNCAFTLDNNNTLVIEPGFTIKSEKKSSAKDLKKIEKVVKSFYPNAVCLATNAKPLGLKLYCDLA